MAFVYVDDIPSAIDLTNRFLMMSGSAKMLLDFSTGYIYATNMTWDAPPGGNNLTFKEQPLRDLFYGLNGQTLAELNESGKLKKINDFIHTRRDELILKKRGRQDLEVTIAKTAIPNDTPIKYHNAFYKIIKSQWVLDQWVYTINIPKSGTMYENLELHGSDILPPSDEYIYVAEQSLRLSPDGITYILHDDMSTIFKTYGLSALWTMAAGLVTNFGLNIWQGTANYMSGLTGLPMLVGQMNMRSWNMPWNWFAPRAVADATRIAGGAAGPLMHRFGQTLYGFTRIGGVYALPAVAVAITLVLNSDLWADTAALMWDTAEEVPPAVAEGGVVAAKALAEHQL